MLPSPIPSRPSLSSGRVPGASANAAKPQGQSRMGRISRQSLIEKGLPRVIRVWKGKGPSAMLRLVKRASKDVYRQLRYGPSEMSKTKATALIQQVQEQLPEAESDKSARSVLKDVQREMRREQEQRQIAAERQVNRAAQLRTEANARTQRLQQLRQATQQMVPQNGQAASPRARTPGAAAATENTPEALQSIGGRVLPSAPPTSSIGHAPAEPAATTVSPLAPLAGASIPSSIPAASTEPLHLTTDVVVPSTRDGHAEEQKDNEDLPDVSQIHEGGLPL